MSQHALDIVTSVSDTESSPDTDLALAVLQAHDGDVLAAIRSLLADTDYLRDQLWIASSLMSSGISRGWKPQYERSEQ